MSPSWANPWLTSRREELGWRDKVKDFLASSSVVIGWPAIAATKFLDPGLSVNTMLH